MGAAVRAGLRFGGIAFLVGGVLGPLRELLLAPRIGGLAAAWVEAAVFAALLWLAAAMTLPREAPLSDRAATAAVALAVVLLAETALGAVFAATGLAAQRAPRGTAELLPGWLLMGCLLALPILRRRG